MNVYKSFIYLAADSHQKTPNSTNPSPILYYITRNRLGHMYAYGAAKGCLR
ncbi:hypothetical protein J45TS6_06210 [Paenibacillus sp. J45TS6]|nr:hypothetical protein J45TS6_06210 [Paenibacillus sp. J45TS6]